MSPPLEELLPDPLEEWEWDADPELEEPEPLEGEPEPLEGEPEPLEGEPEPLEGEPEPEERLEPEDPEESELEKLMGLCA